MDVEERCCRRWLRPRKAAGRIPTRVVPHRRRRALSHQPASGRGAAAARALLAACPGLRHWPAAQRRALSSCRAACAARRSHRSGSDDVRDRRGSTAATRVHRHDRGPIEYEHLHHAGVVEQVEIGVDAPDFPTALRASLRQAPDVIVVGEMRDPETMRIALSAAETGHLVLSTVHTTDAASTIGRISDSFPDERQNTIRQELSMALAAVMTQTLLPKTGGGLVPAAELLMVGYGARQHIRRNALQHLHQETTITRKAGSFTFEESLAHLVRQGLVERQDAMARAFHPESGATTQPARSVAPAL
jgi:hypothetical protein